MLVMRGLKKVVLSVKVETGKGGIEHKTMLYVQIKVLYWKPYTVCKYIFSVYSPYFTRRTCKVDFIEGFSLVVGTLLGIY